MHKVLVAGGGRIGALVAGMLMQSKDYTVAVADLEIDAANLKHLKKTFNALDIIQLDITKTSALKDYIKRHKIEIIVSCLPYHKTLAIAELAKQMKLHYLDLTEDTKVSRAIKELAQDATTLFMPQCGLAPGFITIAAHSLMQSFTTLKAAKLRVGALPQFSNNALQYGLTWSTDGVINQYGNLCHAIRAGKPIKLQPLQDLETLQIDGLAYEAFNTSGGLGNLAERYVGKINELNYKTIRYPGHCKKMRLLMDELQLNQDRATLKHILEGTLAKTYQDVVIIYVSVTGHKQDDYVEEHYVKKVYPQTIASKQWTAIQTATAAGVCAVLDIALQQTPSLQGFIAQEHFSLTDFLSNRFGAYYTKEHIHE